eukprot:10206403-Alexandrium_andersonii.AAC.1
MASCRPGSMNPASSVMAPPASAHVQAGPWVATTPSSCLLLHPDAAGLSVAACRSSWGVGVLVPVSYTHLTLPTICSV